MSAFTRRVSNARLSRLSIYFALMAWLAPVSPTTNALARDSAKPDPIEIIRKFLDQLNDPRPESASSFFSRHGLNEEDVRKGFIEFLETPDVGYLNILMFLITYGEPAISLSGELLTHKNPQVRQAAVYVHTLGALEGAKFSAEKQHALITAITPLLDDPEAQVRSMAVESFKMMVGALGGPHIDESKPGWVGMTDETREVLRAHLDQLKKGMDPSLTYLDEALVERRPSPTEAKNESELNSVKAFADNDIPGDAEALIRDLLSGWEAESHRPSLLWGINSGDSQMARCCAAVYTTLWTSPLDSRQLDLLIQCLGERSLHQLPMLAFRRLRVSQGDPVEAQRIARLRQEIASADPQARRLAALSYCWSATNPAEDSMLDLVAENLRTDLVPLNGQDALEILTHRGEAGAARIRGAFKSRDPQERSLAALGILEEGLETPTLEHIAALAPRLGVDYDSNPGMVDRVRALIRAQERNVVVPGLERMILTNPKDLTIRSRAVRLLGDDESYIPPDNLVPAFIECIRGNGFSADLEIAAQALNRTTSPESTKLLLKAMRSQDRQERLFAAKIYQTSRPLTNPPKVWIRATLENLHDEDAPGVDRVGDYYCYYNAKDTATFLIEHPDLATEELEIGLDNADPQYRWLCAFVLGSTGRGRRLEKLMKFLIPELTNGDREMAIHALGGLGKAAKPYLEPLRKSDDEMVRACVALLLARIKNPRISIFHVPEVAKIDERYMSAQSYEDRAAASGMLDRLARIDSLPDNWTYHDSQ